jgi:hypothetical protein
MYRAGVIPSLDKEGWREAPGWFDARIPQLRSDSYSDPPCVVKFIVARAMSTVLLAMCHCCPFKMSR